MSGWRLSRVPSADASARVLITLAETRPSSVHSVPLAVGSPSWVKEADLQAVQKLDSQARPKSRGSRSRSPTMVILCRTVKQIWAHTPADMHG